MYNGTLHFTSHYRHHHVFVLLRCRVVLCQLFSFMYFFNECFHFHHHHHTKHVYISSDVVCCIQKNIKCGKKQETISVVYSVIILIISNVIIICLCVQKKRSEKGKCFIWLGLWNHLFILLNFFLCLFFYRHILFKYVMMMAKNALCSICTYIKKSWSKGIFLWTSCWLSCSSHHLVIVFNMDLPFTLW